MAKELTKVCEYVCCLEGDQASLQCPPRGYSKGQCEHMTLQWALLQRLLRGTLATLSLSRRGPVLEPRMVLWEGSSVSTCWQIMVLLFRVDRLGKLLVCTQLLRLSIQNSYFAFAKHWLKVRMSNDFPFMYF